MLEKSLTDFGLSIKEAKVYLAALELGQALASTLGRKTGINRSSVYTIITSLKKKGLIGVFRKRGVDYFCAADPDILWRKEEQALISQQMRMKKLSRLMASLQALPLSSSHLPGVRFYEGFEGVKYVYEDTLKDGVTEIFSFWAVDAMPAAVENYLFYDYIPRRAKASIKCFVVAPDLPKGRQIKERDSAECRETVLVTPHEYPFDVEINIYQDKVSFMNYKSDEEMAVIVENPLIFNTMRSIHKLCFRKIIQ